MKGGDFPKQHIKQNRTTLDIRLDVIKNKKLLNYSFFLKKKSPPKKIRRKIFRNKN